MQEANISIKTSYALHTHEYLAPQFFCANLRVHRPTIVEVNTFRKSRELQRTNSAICIAMAIMLYQKDATRRLTLNEVWLSLWLPVSVWLIAIDARCMPEPAEVPTNEELWIYALAYTLIEIAAKDLVYSGSEFTPAAVGKRAN